ncbi:MAG TPA: metalloregulator ArsR/SmtB family transcription factor [Acidimicrobiales bacterium]|nr:metalloregulator ArsR/SmtB family transcription factor [Acidimicrobiales bacterium]
MSEHPSPPAADRPDGVRSLSWPEEVEATAGSDDLVFRALGDPTRRRILLALAAQEMPAGHVAALFPISGPSVSRHLTVLRSAGLVKERREGNRLICSLAAAPLASTIGRLMKGLALDADGAITGPAAGRDRSGGDQPAYATGSEPRKKKPKPADDQPKKKNKKDKRRASQASEVAPEPVLPGPPPGPKLT